MYIYLFDRALENTASAKIGTNGQLMLPSISKDHEGEWSCHANNTFGNSDLKFKSKLIVKPFEGQLQLLISHIVIISLFLLL